MAELALRTVSRIRAALRTALFAAMKRELIARNVAALADVPAVEAGERLFFSTAQARQLLGAIKAIASRPSSPSASASGFDRQRSSACGGRTWTSTKSASW